MKELEISIDPMYGGESFFVNGARDLNITMSMQYDDFKDMSTNRLRFVADITDEIESLEKLLLDFGDDKEYVSSTLKLIDNCENCLKDSNKLFENFVENFDYIKLSMSSNQEILDFLDKNPELHDKKIVKRCKYSINDIEKLKKDAEELSKYKDQLYFELEGNISYVDLETCLNTMEIIKKEAEMISKITLSPLETIAYVYDYVRNRVYNPETDGNIYSSRDLSNVLFGDNIVCTGYSAHFNAILKQLGFDCYNISLKNIGKENGHSRSGVYVSDPIYKIEGFYYFDPTFDSKKSEDDKSYLKSYNFFANTKYQIDSKSRKVERKLSKFYDYAFKDQETLKDEFNYCNTAELREYAETGRNILKYTHSMPNEVVVGSEKQKKLMKDALKKFDQTIPVKTLLEVIINVRLKEYENDPEYFPLSVEELYDIFIESDWVFSENKLSSADRMLYAIFNDLPQAVIDKGDFMFEGDFYNFIYENKFDKDIKDCIDRYSDCKKRQKIKK